MSIYAPCLCLILAILTKKGGQITIFCSELSHIHSSINFCWNSLKTGKYNLFPEFVISLKIWLLLPRFAVNQSLVQRENNYALVDIKMLNCIQSKICYFQLIAKTPFKLILSMNKGNVPKRNVFLWSFANPTPNGLFTDKKDNPYFFFLK